MASWMQCLTSQLVLVLEAKVYEVKVYGVVVKQSAMERVRGISMILI